MGIFFFDSSALAKRYVKERGSAWIAGLMHPSGTNQIHIARISGAEVVAAIARRTRAGSLRSDVGAAALSQFRRDFERWVCVEITADLIRRAMDLAEGNALRGYDAVQLAAAMTVRDRGQRLGLTLAFVCADETLNAAAAAQGLPVENPNQLE